MGRQRNMTQMKEQETSPEKELNKMEESNLPDTEFKWMVIRMLKELRGRIGKLSENLNKEIISIEGDIETIRSWSEINAISEMKNTWEVINSWLIEAENQISDFKDKVAENTQWKQQKKKKKN